MIELDAEKMKEGIYYLSNPNNFNQKENLYIKVREKENRIYSDEILKFLPDVSQSHPQFDEWKIRKATAENLINYFLKYNDLTILDVGAGNCWMSNLISQKTKNCIFALDLNQTELIQAVRVFGSNKKLKFFYGNIFDDIFKPEVFDVILFSSSIQYFSDFEKTINCVKLYLKKNGEIHITDTNFYESNEIENAKERTKTYYSNLGFPESAENYNHHLTNNLKNFNFVIKNRNSVSEKLLNKIGFKKSSPFPWIIIKNK